METINTTPYRFHCLDCSTTPELPARSLIVKGTFKLRVGAKAEAIPANDQTPMLGDMSFMDDLGRSLKTATDLVAYKTRGEVMMHASCHAGLGRTKTECDVTMAVGPIEKTLRVTGDRAWASKDSRVGMTTPRPFDKMPIRWERAFGALSNLENPLGRGVDLVPGPTGEIAWVPNVEYPNQRVVTPTDRPTPAGFGPVSPAWNPRSARQGTRDQRWAAFRAPLPPEDFDMRFHNAAPDDQQLEAGVFFRGDEAIRLKHLNADVEEYRSALPGKRLRVFISMRGATPRFVEVFMNLDTVFIDADKEELIVVWRRPVSIASQAMVEIEAFYVAEEDLATEPLPEDVHYAAFRELKPLPGKPKSEVVQEDVDAQMAEATKTLEKGNVDPKVIREVQQAKSPDDAFALLMRYAEQQIQQLERMAASAPPR